MSEESGRPQDQGRRHRRGGNPSPATRSLLADYQAAMRDELRATLGELRPVAPDPGLGLVAEPPKRPPLRDRAALWDLAIKLGRELAGEIDASPAAEPAAESARPRRRRVDFG